MTVTNPHDALFKAAFGRPDVARGELELMLPPALRAQLALDTLEVLSGSFVDEELRQTHADILFAVATAANRDALVYVVFEHQSTFDPLIPFRLLRYMVRVWERWLRDHPEATALPIVLPVLLHHGASGWRAAPEFASVLDASPALLESVRPFQPMFRFVMDDLAALSLEELAARSFHALTRLVQLGFWSGRSHRRLLEAAPLMRAIVRSAGREPATRDLLTQLYTYLLRVAEPDVAPGAIRGILSTIAGTAGEGDIVNAAEHLIEQGRVEGLEKGLEKGRVEGLEKGRREGLREAIVAALAARGVSISAEGQARIAACADMDALQRWLVRAVTASSDADVFSLVPGRSRDSPPR